MISGENEYGPAGRRPRRKIPAAVAVLSSPHSGHPAERLVSGSFSAFRPGLDTGWHYPGGWHVARTDLGNTDSIWALLLLFPVTFIMTRFVIQREEDYLARTFGEDYERYKKSGRRWI